MAVLMTRAQLLKLKSLVDGVEGITIDDGAITAAKLASSAVTEAKIGTGAVTVNKIGAGAVSSAKLATAVNTTITDGTVKVLQVEVAGVENAGDDISGKTLFVVPTGYAFTLTDARIISRGTAAGIDNSNTSVVEVKNGTDAAASKTFNTSTVFPADQANTTLTIDTDHDNFAAGDVIKVDVTNGATAKPPAFTVQLVGTLTTAS